MRFRRSDAPPPYLNRRDQMRMLTMVGLLILVVVAMRWAARPESWYWLVPPDPKEMRADGGETQPEVDFTVRNGNVELQPDEFLAPGNDDEPRTEESGPAETSPEEISISDHLLENIRDNTFGIGSAERAAYEATLRKVRNTDAGKLKAVAHRNVGFHVLMTESDYFRGEPIVVEGEVRRLLSYEEGENDADVGQLYEAWLFTRDSGTNPYRIVAHEITDGMPQGKLMEAPVRARVTGYFFKRQGYAAQNKAGVHVAPLILAKRIEWVQPAAPIPLTNPAPYIVGTVLVIGLFLGLTLWRITAGDNRFRRGQFQRVTTARREAIDSLNDLETIDPSEWFRQMSRDAEAAESAEG